MSGEMNEEKLSVTVGRLLSEIAEGVSVIYGNGYVACQEQVKEELRKILKKQDDYINHIFTFTLDLWGEIHTLEFIKGMTWGEWCESEYNTVDLYINEEQGNSVYHGVSSVMDTSDPNGLYRDTPIVIDGCYIV